MVGLGSLSILLKIDRAKEMGDSPCNWIILLSLSNLSTHHKIYSLKSYTYGTHPADAIMDVQILLKFFSRGGNVE